MPGLLRPAARRPMARTSMLFDAIELRAGVDLAKRQQG